MGRLLLAIIFLVFALPSHGEEDILHVLKGRIIRSLAIDNTDPNHILVGQKASKPGTAFVFQSTDGGRTWRFLNGNRPLAPEATDVQAVVAASREILLAGTWKHGLFISRDGGSRFFPVTGFPSSDIRDLQVADGVVFAATARRGIFESRDRGETWRAIGPGNAFFWSITSLPNRLLASSLDGGVHEYNNGRWRKVFDGDKAYAAAVGSELLAIAGESGLYIAADKQERKALGGEKFADVVFDADGIVAASWSNGLVFLTPDGRVRKRLLESKPVVHLQMAGNRLLAGTWGDGLYSLSGSPVPAPIPLIEATLDNDAERVRRLLESGADPNAFDANRNTALIFASRDGRTDIVRLLIAAGADPDWIDGEEVTPLILAAHKDHIAIVRLLLALDIDRGRRDKWGRTALDYAERRGTDDPIYRMLAE